MLANRYQSANPELLFNVDNFEPITRIYYWTACEKDKQALFGGQIYLHTKIKGYLCVVYLPKSSKMTARYFQRWSSIDKKQTSWTQLIIK